jgi:hypothetical protein
MEELECLALAEDATDMLGRVLSRIHLPGVRTPDDRWQQIRALLYSGVLAVRSLRVEMALLRVGYGSDVFVFHRRLAELLARVQRFVAEPGGAHHARDWLEGRDGGARKVAALDPDIWDFLSHVAHADYRAVEQHLLVTREDGNHEFVMLPSRNVVRANATLVVDSGVIRDITMLIARFVGEPLPGLAALDAAIHAAQARWLDSDDEGHEQTLTL